MCPESQSNNWWQSSVGVTQVCNEAFLNVNKITKNVYHKKSHLCRGLRGNLRHFISSGHFTCFGISAPSWEYSDMESGMLISAVYLKHYSDNYKDTKGCEKHTKISTGFLFMHQILLKFSCVTSTGRRCSWWRSWGLHTRQPSCQWAGRTQGEALSGSWDNY